MVLWACPDKEAFFGSRCGLVAGLRDLLELATRLRLFRTKGSIDD